MHKIIKIIEKKISEQISNKNVLLCGSGSEAFINILDKIALNTEDEILIPNFLCEIIMAPIIKKKIKYQLIDVEKGSILPSLNEYKEKYSSNTKVILISYLWGYVHHDIKEIIKWAKEQKLIIIEDISSAYMLSYNNLKLGTLGNYTFGSFGSGKFIDVGKYGFIASKERFKSINKLEGRNILNYTKLIKRLRKIGFTTIRNFLTKIFLKQYTDYLKIEYDKESLNLLYKKLCKIDKIYLSKLINTKLFISELKSCDNIKILIPNNDKNVSNRLACICKDSKLINKLKFEKCWVGTDYSMPINEMLNNIKIPNSTKLSKKIINLLTGDDNPTIHLTIDIIKKGGV